MVYKFIKLDNMKSLIISIFINIIIPSLVKSQNIFKEGIIVYKCDSAINMNGGNYYKVNRQIKLYKKDDLYRLESITRSLYKSFKSEIEVQIINDKGKYIFKDSSFPEEQFAIFVSIEEERQLLSQRAINGQLKVFKVEKIYSHKPLLSIPVEAVILKNVNNNVYINLLLAISIKTKFGLFFEDYRNLEGTPLQFYDYEGDILYHYTATSIVRKPIGNDIFFLNPKYKVLTVGQMSK